MNNQYKGVLFLKGKKGKGSLKPETILYGQVISSTKTVFLSPYIPPINSIKIAGIVQSKEDWELQSPLLINISRTLSCGKGFFNHQWHEFPVEIVYSSALYERTPFDKSELDLLSNAHVLILGAGTGGGKIALELAKSGVGHIALCDPDRLEWPNVSRHEGNLLDVGKFKTELIVERIYYTNPSIQVSQYHEDIFKWEYEAVKSLFTSYDLVIAATDKTSVQLMINELTQNLKIPCVFGGCYEEALGGEVFFTIPDESMPCLACLRGGLQQPKRTGAIDYSTASGPEDYQGQPGLHAMIDFVTCTEIVICLAILLRQQKHSSLAQLIDPKQNFLLVGGALGEGFYRFKKPFDVFFQKLSGPRKNCMVCQTSATMEI